MTAPRYLPVATFKLWTKTETTVDASLVEDEINAAETDIDSELHRRVEVADPVDSSARVYRPGHYSRTLVIDDAAAIVSVVENSVTLVSGTDYIAEPLNGIDEAGKPMPYAWLTRLDRDWYTNGDRATVTVTARWGWDAVPAEIVSACKIVTADRLSNREFRNGLAAITVDGVGIGGRTNRTVADSIRHYRHPYKSLGIA